DLAKDRSDGILGENLQQQALPLDRRPIDQDLVRAQPLDVLAVARHTGIDPVEIRSYGVLETYPAIPHAPYRVVDILGPESEMLDTFAAVGVQKLLDLRLVCLALVQRD